MSVTAGWRAAGGLPTPVAIVAAALLTGALSWAVITVAPRWVSL